MPLYDFKCDKCDEYFSEIAPMGTQEMVHSCGEKGRKVIKSSPWQKIDVGSDRWVNRHKKRMR